VENIASIFRVEEYEKQNVSVKQAKDVNQRLG
jgi:hypothetical protein